MATEATESKNICYLCHESFGEKEITQTWKGEPVCKRCARYKHISRLILIPSAIIVYFIIHIISSLFLSVSGVPFVILPSGLIIFFVVKYNIDPLARKLSSKSGNNVEEKPANDGDNTINFSNESFNLRKLYIAGKHNNTTELEKQIIDKYRLAPDNVREETLLFLSLEPNPEKKKNKYKEYSFQEASIILKFRYSSKTIQNKIIEILNIQPISTSDTDKTENTFNQAEAQSDNIHKEIISAPDLEKDTNQTKSLENVSAKREGTVVRDTNSFNKTSKIDVTSNRKNRFIIPLFILSGILLCTIALIVFQAVLINNQNNTANEQAGIISELEIQKNKDSQEIGRLNKIVSEQSLAIRSKEEEINNYDLLEPELNWYRTNVAITYGSDKQFYHTAYCAKMVLNAYKSNDSTTIYSRNEAWNLGYRPCPSCY